MACRYIQLPAEFLMASRCWDLCWRQPGWARLQHVGILEHFRSLAGLEESVELDKGIVVGDTAPAAEERLQVNPGVPLGVALVEEGNSDSTAAAAVGIAPDIRERWNIAESVDPAAAVGTQQAVVAAAYPSQLASLLSPHRTETWLIDPFVHTGSRNIRRGNTTVSQIFQLNTYTWTTLPH